MTTSSALGRPSLCVLIKTWAFNLSSLILDHSVLRIRVTLETSRFAYIVETRCVSEFIRSLLTAVSWVANTSAFTWIKFFNHYTQKLLFASASICSPDLVLRSEIVEIWRAVHSKTKRFVEGQQDFMFFSLELKHHMQHIFPVEIETWSVPVCVTFGNGKLYPERLNQQQEKMRSLFSMNRYHFHYQRISHFLTNLRRIEWRV